MTVDTKLLTFNLKLVNEKLKKKKPKSNNIIPIVLYPILSIIRETIQINIEIVVHIILIFFICTPI